jgi:hypothetical protein
LIGFAVIRAAAADIDNRRAELSNFHLDPGRCRADYIP